MTGTVPVLMYHAISADPPRATHRLSVHPDAFRAQMAFLAENGFSAVPFSHLAAATDGARRPLPPRPVVLTFDDGYADFHRAALPLLADLGWPATVFVTTGWIADESRRAGRPLDAMLCWSQIAEAAAAGMEIGAHGHSHAALDQLPDSALTGELRDSRRLLEDRLGRAVPTLAYPFGYSSPRVHRAVRAASYDLGAAVRNRRASPAGDPLAVPRLTIRRSTGPEFFARVLTGDQATSAYWWDRSLTAGYAGVRRARRVVVRGAGRG